MEADYLTVHMPLTDQTRGMVDADAFSKMKDGVRVFNCARGGIIDENALLEALRSGKVAAAGLDVYEQEPLPEDHPFRKEENLILTPHLDSQNFFPKLSVFFQMFPCSLPHGTESKDANIYGLGFIICVHL